MSENSEFWDTIPYFKKSEFTCKCGCGHNNISNELVRQLNKARTISKIPFKINSACRCEKHNRSEKGSETSSHLKGYAVDISISSSFNRFKILQALMAVGFKRIGVYKDFIHCDIDSDKSQNVVWYK